MTKQLYLFLFSLYFMCQGKIYKITCVLFMSIMIFTLKNKNII